MRRPALAVAAVVIAAALVIVATRPGASTTPVSSRTPPTTATAPATTSPRTSRADVLDQRDQVTPKERDRIRRTRLLQETLVTAAQAHGVSITAGNARTSDRGPQQMVVTPDPSLTVREIADAVSRICGALKDPCVRRDYRFLIQTPTGQALLPARLIHPKD